MPSWKWFVTIGSSREIHFDWRLRINVIIWAGKESTDTSSDSSYNQNVTTSIFTVKTLFRVQKKEKVCCDNGFYQFDQNRGLSLLGVIGMKVKEYRKQSADNPGQNLLREIAKIPICSCHPGKNWNLRQMNARCRPVPYRKLFRITWKLYTLVFRPRQLWIESGEGANFFCLEETGLGRKS